MVNTKAQTDAASALSIQAMHAAAPQQGANDTLVKIAMAVAAAFVGMALFGGKKA
jgi:hypothetical protein